MSDITAIKQALAYVPEFLTFQQSYMPFVGAQVAVRVEGELVLNHAVGFSDLANETPLTTDHLFRIASHSKTFTGTAILQLVEQGKVRLDDEAQQHVPEIAGSPMATVSVRELLSHLSGMTRDGDDSTFWALNRPFPDREELIVTIRNDGKVIEPNEHFKYSNIGFSLLGLIIEAVSGMSYREYVTANIVDRLGLENTGPELDMTRLDEYAKGWSSRVHGPDRIEIEHIDTFAESSATGFYSNASELTAYFQAHLDGNDTLISDASKRKMRQIHSGVSATRHYGLGLSIDEVNGRTYYGHNGGYPGHITASKFDLERKLSISVLTNSADGPASVLCAAILHLIDLALDAKHEAKTDPQADETLAPFTGRFSSLWGILDVVNLGGRLYSTTPASPNPAADASELEVVSESEVKCIGDDGYGGYNEIMRYTFDDQGRATDIRGASGAHLIPIENFVLPEFVSRPYDAAAVAAE